ncbi:GNAT family N-acetyltransferase [Nannocystis punicea]|uniref:GNAT family N-acetyltransferase n=1 Tax=Nannocystis punicea TaxID=2995304 RepID=A0ABY7HDL2_9BACT|nr:GNAT family N-acetyltransferase [Nannocystis poenicansa]WAS97380.1 GNAT family N-acetyltransferase [Nannocystis poenicansa]
MPEAPSDFLKKREPADDRVTLTEIRTMADYPPGLVGAIAGLFGRCMTASHGTDWRVDVMIAEGQCEFFRRFDPERDRVWFARQGGVLCGALTIDGPRPESGCEAARLRFFILDEATRGLGLGRRMVAAAMAFCRERGYSRVYLTTLPGLDTARRLYEEHGFRLIAQDDPPFCGSDYGEQTFEWRAS